MFPHFEYCSVAPPFFSNEQKRGATPIDHSPRGRPQKFHLFFTLNSAYPMPVSLRYANESFLLCKCSSFIIIISPIRIKIKREEREREKHSGVLQRDRIRTYFAKRQKRKTNEHSLSLARPKRTNKSTRLRGYFRYGIIRQIN